MNPVTKERLLATLDRISDVCHKRDKYADVIRQSAANGLRAHLTGSIAKIENDKLELEMTLAGVPFPKSEEEIERLIDIKVKLYDHYHEWRERVYAIQAHHKISGVEIKPCKILGTEIEQPNICSGDGLPYVPEDMSILREYRPKIVARFMQALRSHGITRCEKTVLVKSEGKRYFDTVTSVDAIVPIEEILVASPLFDWAFVYNDCNDCDSPAICFGNGLDGTSAIAGHVSFRGLGG